VFSVKICDLCYDIIAKSKSVCYNCCYNKNSETKSDDGHIHRRQRHNITLGSVVRWTIKMKVPMSHLPKSPLLKSPTLKSTAWRLAGYSSHNSCKSKLKLSSLYVRFVVCVLAEVYGGEDPGIKSIINAGCDLTKSRD